MTLNNAGGSALSDLGRLHALIHRGTAGAIVWFSAAIEFTFRYSAAKMQPAGPWSADNAPLLSLDHSLALEGIPAAMGNAITAFEAQQEVSVRQELAAGAALPDRVEQMRWADDSPRFVGYASEGHALHHHLTKTVGAWRVSSQADGVAGLPGIDTYRSDFEQLAESALTALAAGWMAASGAQFKQVEIQVRADTRKTWRTERPEA